MLHWACLYGDMAMAELLISMGADVKAKNKVWTRAGGEALRGMLGEEIDRTKWTADSRE